MLIYVGTAGSMTPQYAVQDALPHPHPQHSAAPVHGYVVGFMARLAPSRRQS